MNNANQTDSSQKKPFIVRAIDFLVNNLLFVALLALFITVFKKIFGKSEIANIIGFIFSLSLASIFFKLIDKSFSGFIILVHVASLCVGFSVLIHVADFQITSG